MWLFIRKSFAIFCIPLLWLAVSVFTQRTILNPIGNPEVKAELQSLQDSSIVFVGPSTFHRRIDAPGLSDSLRIPVSTVTSDGQSLVESIHITSTILSHYPHTKVILAGQNMKIQGKGFHQCWACSNLDWRYIWQNFDHVSECFWFDAFNGILAALIPSRKRMPLIKETDTLESGWDERHEFFIAEADSILKAFTLKLSRNRPLPDLGIPQHILSTNRCELLIPLDGQFYQCPTNGGLPCTNFGDSTWLSKDLWQDDGHLNSKGVKIFNERILTHLMAVSNGQQKH